MYKAVLEEIMEKQEPLSKGQLEMIEYAKKSIDLHIDRIFCWVLIFDKKDHSKNIYMQNTLARKFLNDVEWLWEKFNCTLEQAQYLQTYLYVDCL